LEERVEALSSASATNLSSDISSDPLHSLMERKASKAQKEDGPLPEAEEQELKLSRSKRPTFHSLE
jgi:hypothetical protein